MASRVQITDRKELEEFVRTHLGHRLTAMISPICLPGEHPWWSNPSRRNDAYRAAKEGSYSMLRLFIEFLGVKEDRRNPGKLKVVEGEDDTILLDAFSKWGVAKVQPKDFGSDEPLIAQVHRTLCKINAHFTYDSSKTKSYDRIDSPDDDMEWKPAVEIVVSKLDEFFYAKVNLPITIQFDLVADFDAQFAKKLHLKSSVKGDDLGRP
jgi:hypothetical protein